MTKLTITWEIKEEDQEVRADKETDVLAEFEGDITYINKILTYIKGYINLHLEDDIEYDGTEMINIEKIVNETGLDEVKVRTVLVKLSQIGIIKSKQIPTYKEEK